MRNLVFILALAVVLAASGTAFAISGENFGGALKVGVDFAGEIKVEGAIPTNEQDTDTGVSVCAEGYYHVNEYFDAGVGIQYLFEREIDNSGGAKFWFLPIYGVVRLHPAMTNYTPYLIGQIGYNFHDGNTAYTGSVDVEGDLYWGGGAGFIYKRHFLAEILYSESRGSADTPDIDITYRKVTFGLGYNF